MARIETRFRVGDYVLYEYSGSWLPASVRLTEEVTRQDGNRLTIEVRARRGDDERRWIQVVIDTPEHREGNMVEELYEIVDGDIRYLENKGNADVRRLYEWVLPPRGKQLSETRKSERRISLPDGSELAAECSQYQVEIGGRIVAVEYCRSQEFLWNHISLRYWDAATDAVLFEAKVLRVGNKRSDPGLCE